jgi:hypothetical protein
MCMVRYILGTATNNFAVIFKIKMLINWKPPNKLGYCQRILFFLDIISFDIVYILPMSAKYDVSKQLQLMLHD